ncbi:hypothetical protein DFH06DRAFT_1484003 [Mycena polygramma]|nr:hypothetical protein DFH06DRAFT_1484003 [Mycena polygramma]
MSILPDEILSEILSPALKVSDDLFSDTSDVSPFAKPLPSTSAYLVVCRDWLRVATPLLYNVVVLRSKSQANALEKVLVKNSEFGRFIKKLRVEGGYGIAMHTILKSAPNITDIFLSLVIWSSDSTQGLCKGLPLINPRRVILVDPNTRKLLKNQNLAALTKVVLSCISKWDNLRIFDFPYMCPQQYRRSNEAAWMLRATLLAEALARSQVQTILIPALRQLPTFFFTLTNITSVQVVQFKAESYAMKWAIDKADARVKALVRYASEKPAEDQGRADPTPDISPSLNPSFVPMESALDGVREFVWKRVLFFAMSVEEHRTLPLYGAETLPSRLPILLVSKYISRLALPYMFDRLNLHITHKVASLGSQLEARPELGACIRSIHWLHYVGPPDTMLTVLSCAKSLEIFSSNAPTSPEHLELLATCAGSSLRELTIHTQNNQIPASLFARLQELRVLELSCSGAIFTCDPTAQNGLNKLHTIRIKYLVRDLSFLQAFSPMSLDSLHTLQFINPPPSDGSAVWEALSEFLTAHRKTLLHLKAVYDPQNIENFKLFDVCKELLDVEFMGTVPPTVLTCTTPHLSLTKIIMSSHVLAVPDDFDPAMFPMLREIQTHVLKWPTTEREISKSTWVPLAEAWLKHGIKVTDSHGQYWIPRVKRSRGR